MIDSQHWKLGIGSAKGYVDSRCVVSVIYKQVDVIERPGNTIQISLKEIKLVLTTMGFMWNNLHKMEKGI